MTDREWIEILATHADQLNADPDGETKYLAQLSERQDTLRPLLTLARKLKDALTPVEPDPAFREALRRSLLATAGQQLVSRLGRSAERSRRLQAGQHDRANLQREGSTAFLRKYKREILIGAVVSVIGIVAYWIHVRAARVQHAPA